MAVDLNLSAKPGFLSGQSWVETASALSKDCSAVGLQNVLRSRTFAPELSRLAQRRKRDAAAKGAR
jgi:hypothetical protein